MTRENSQNEMKMRKQELTEKEKKLMDSFNDDLTGSFQHERRTSFFAPKSPVSGNITQSGGIPSRNPSLGSNE